MENVGSYREDFKDILGTIRDILNCRHFGTIRAVVVVLLTKSFEGPSENSLIFWEIFGRVVRDIVVNFSAIFYSNSR